uniref:(northern house mosquito) hypothetical protein n=1 Tax=Culex pipiens TaxID=7175 RepID=A0A8D8CM74_CULPI
MLPAREHRLAGDGVLRRVRVRHHRGAQAAAQGGGNFRHLRRRAARAQLSALARPDSSRHQGGQHPADGAGHREAGRFWQRCHQVSRQQLRRHALLDGTGSDPGDGRRPVRRQGGRVVTRNNLH